MRTRYMLQRLLAAAAMPFVLQYGGCVTTNQLKDFVRTEVALVATQLIAAPVNEALIDLAGPQVIEEIVPSI